MARVGVAAVEGICDMSARNCYHSPAGGRAQGDVAPLEMGATAALVAPARTSITSLLAYLPHVVAYEEGLHLGEAHFGCRRLSVADPHAYRCVEGPVFLGRRKVSCPEDSLCHIARFNL